MRVLFLTPYLGASYGGITKVTQELTQALGQLNIHLDLVTTVADDQNTLQQPINRWIDQQGYRVKYFPCIHRGDFIFSISLLRWLQTHLKAYDITHTHTLFCPLISWATHLCRQQQVPYLVTPHGMLEPWAFSYKSWKKKVYYQFIEQNTLNKAAAIQGISSTELQNLNHYALTPQRFLVPNGIHREDFQILPSPEPFYAAFPHTQGKSLILFLARIDPKKGLDLLAPAFAALKQQFPKSHLVIAGPDSIGFRSTVERYFAQVNCQNDITFTGMLSGTLKYAALSAAQVYVAPSYSEGFSMSVLEGMATGLPCVITTGCNFPEAEKAQAAHVVDINSESIAQALIQCFTNPDAAKEMGHRARQFILANYTWDSIAKKMIEVYEDILNDRPIPYTSCQ